MIGIYGLKKSCKNQCGFTLVEMAMVMLISGLLSVSILDYYQSYTNAQKVEKTNDSIIIVQGALREYLNIMGAYPCPADPALSPDNVNYGISFCNGQGGTAMVAGSRDTDADGNLDPVLIGVLPIKAILNFYQDNGITKDVPLTEAAGYDGWGNKLTYAVTRSQTDTTTFDQRRGAIAVVDENDQNILNPVGSAHFVVLSHGPNGIGSYGSGGGLSQDCTPSVILGPPGPTVIVTTRNELDNCDYIDAVFVSGLKNQSDYSYFDDSLKFFSFEQTDLWRPSPTLDYYAYNTNAGFVGFNQSEPQQRLDIEGRLRASQIDAQRFCDRGGADCMDVELLAGERSEMQCGGLGLTKISEGEFSACIDYRRPAPAGLRCPVGQIMRGYSASTGLDCVARPF